VLEHLSSPFDTISEFYRILKPNGTLILTVPHLSCYHDLPGDYYRFTAFGISFLLKKAGFKITLVQSCGGLLCFIGHIFSHMILGYAGRYRLLRNFVLTANSLFSRTIVFIDSLLKGLNNIAPLNIIVVSTKC
jgi:ubiquinone/menaquinone biosynthesis C-methylase UbiE